MAAFDVSRFGSFLATRDTGSKVRDELEREARNVGDGETILVSFDDVEAVTISFADEFIGRLFAARASGDLPEVAIVITNLNHEVREALAICLERRGVAAVATKGRKLELLTADEYLKATFAAAMRRKKFRAGDMASDLGITPQSANNRLKKLVEFGALTRKRTAPTGGGKEFIYRIPSTS